MAATSSAYVGAWVATRADGGVSESAGMVSGAVVMSWLNPGGGPVPLVSALFQNYKIRGCSLVPSKGDFPLHRALLSSISDCSRL